MHSAGASGRSVQHDHSSIRSEAFHLNILFCTKTGIIKGALFDNQLHVFALVSVGLTHAGDDAVHRQPRGGVVEAGDRQALVVLLLLLEDEGGVLLLGDVDVVAGVSGGHDVSRARIQEDALVLLPLHPNQTHAVPAQTEVTWDQNQRLPHKDCMRPIDRVTDFLWAWKEA